MSTKIEYNGSIVATVEGGNKATIPVRGKKMATDILVTVPESSGGDSAVPIEVSTEAEMTALLESGEVGGVYKYVGTSGTYENGAFYVLEEVDPAEGVIGTWTLNPSSFDFSMIRPAGFLMECNASGYWFDGNSKQPISFTSVAITPRANVFQLTEPVFTWSVVRYYEYPKISSFVANVDEYPVSTVDNNNWNEYSTFTINSVSTEDLELVNELYAFLSANATKQ